MTHTHTLECKLSPEAYYCNPILSIIGNCGVCLCVCESESRPYDLKIRKLPHDTVAACLSSPCYLIWRQTEFNFTVAVVKPGLYLAVKTLNHSAVMMPEWLYLMWREVSSRKWRTSSQMPCLKTEVGRSYTKKVCRQSREHVNDISAGSWNSCWFSFFCFLPFVYLETSS